MNIPTDVQDLNAPPQDGLPYPVRESRGRLERWSSDNGPKTESRGPITSSLETLRRQSMIERSANRIRPGSSEDGCQNRIGRVAKRCTSSLLHDYEEDKAVEQHMQIPSMPPPPMTSTAFLSPFPRQGGKSMIERSANRIRPRSSVDGCQNQIGRASKRCTSSLLDDYEEDEAVRQHMQIPLMSPPLMPSAPFLPTFPSQGVKLTYAESGALQMPALRRCNCS